MAPQAFRTSVFVHPTVRQGSCCTWVVSVAKGGAELSYCTFAVALTRYAGIGTPVPSKRYQLLW